MRPPGKAILRHTWLEPLGPNVERNYDHLIFLSSLSTSRSMSRFTNVLLFDCLDLVEFPSCHPVTHEQLFAGTGNCIQSPFQSCSIASLAWLGTRPPCPLHSSRICYLALCYRDDTHTHPRTRAHTHTHTPELLNSKSPHLLEVLAPASGNQ